MRAAIPHLQRRPDFLRVAGTGRKAVFPGLILQAAPQPDSAPALPPRRVGYTASRKVGNAVARNRARRRMRAACDAMMVLHAAPGHDYVLIAREATVARPWLLLLDDLKRAMKKLGVWRDAAPARIESPEAE